MLYQLSYARAPSGGGRIRTFVGCRRQIYSLLPLATRAPHRALLGPSDDAPRVRNSAGCVYPSELDKGRGSVLFLFGNVS